MTIQKQNAPLILIGILLVASSLIMIVARERSKAKPYYAPALPYVTEEQILEMKNELPRLEPGDAVDLVLRIEEVQEWMAEFSNDDGSSPVTGGRPKAMVDSYDPPITLVHVYEDTEERIITFGWYEVNEETGEVTSALPNF